MASRALLIILFAILGGVIMSLSAVSTSAQAAVTLVAFNARVVRQGVTSHGELTWRTTSEVHTAGYNIYRSARADGPYARINAQLIPAVNDAKIGGTYKYFDNDVQSGQTYYYQLEDVEISGKGVRHPPVGVTGLETQFGSDMWIGVCWGVGALAIVLGGLNLALRSR
ncbi:MAG: hypothetical protein HY868_13460 [Chloroflexi bacterium]|nr:hypothetical protein [Chloroflexota bacterium]